MQHYFLCNITYVVIAESMEKSLKYTEDGIRLTIDHSSNKTRLIVEIQPAEGGSGVVPANQAKLLTRRVVSKEWLTQLQQYSTEIKHETWQCVQNGGREWDGHE